MMMILLYFREAELAFDVIDKSVGSEEKGRWKRGKGRMLTKQHPQNEQALSFSPY